MLGFSFENLKTILRLSEHKSYPKVNSAERGCPNTYKDYVDHISNRSGTLRHLIMLKNKHLECS